MMWQDTLISISNILFTFSIACQVNHGFKLRKGFITLPTSGITAIGLYAMTFGFFSLDLFYSTIVTGVNAGLWTVLFFQRLLFDNAK